MGSCNRKTGKNLSRKHVSVIITTRENLNTFKKCLFSILSQLPREVKEILVITPRENIVKFIDRMRKKYGFLRVIKDPGKGKPAALNIAFKNAQYEILVLTDGDVILGKRAIENLLKHFDNKDVGAVCGNVVFLISPSSLFFEWAKLSEYVFHERRKTLSFKRSLWHITGYLYAIRKKCLPSSIPHEVLAEDTFIGLSVIKKGYKIVYEENAKVYVKFPSTIRDFIVQKSRTRAGFVQLGKMYRRTPRTLSQEIPNLKYILKFYSPLKLWKFFVVGAIYFISWVWAYFLVFQKKSLKEIWKDTPSTKGLI